MAIKVLKATRINGLKNKILEVINYDQHKRKFNRFETLNAINAISRTKFFHRKDANTFSRKEYKYRAYRVVRDGDKDKMYDIEYIFGAMYLTY